jgi:uncharacterized protein (AIM24 family)
LKADSVGGITPAVLASLRPKEKILAAHGLMLYKEPQVKVGRRTMRQLGVSMGTYMSMHGRGDQEENYFFAEFEGPGHVSFSRDKGGEVRIRDLAAGETFRLREGHLICFDESVRYQPQVVVQWTATNANGESENRYVFADALTGPGTIVFQAYGNILSFTLGPGESIRTSTEGFLAAQHTVAVQLQGGGGPLPTPTPTRRGLAGLAAGALLSAAVNQSIGVNVPTVGGGGRASGSNPLLYLTGPGTVLVHSGV